MLWRRPYIVLLNNITKGGMITGLSICFLYLASAVPGVKLTLIALSSIILGLVYKKQGIKLVIYIYIAVSLLAILIVPLKTVVILYIFMFGFYPIIKFTSEKLVNKKSIWLIKIIFANISLSIILIIAHYILSLNIPFVFLIYIGYNIIFIAYDLAFTRILEEVRI